MGPNTTAQHLLNKGKAFLLASNLEEAKECCELAIADSREERAAVYQTYAKCLALLGDHRTAVAFLGSLADLALETEDSFAGSIAPAEVALMNLGSAVYLAVESKQYIHTQSEIFLSAVPAQDFVAYSQWVRKRFAGELHDNPSFTKSVQQMLSSGPINRLRGKVPPTLLGQRDFISFSQALGFFQVLLKADEFKHATRFKPPKNHSEMQDLLDDLHGCLKRVNEVNRSVAARMRKDHSTSPAVSKTPPAVSEPPQEAKRRRTAPPKVESISRQSIHARHLASDDRTSQLNLTARLCVFSENGAHAIRASDPFFPYQYFQPLGPMPSYNYEDADGDDGYVIALIVSVGPGNAGAIKILSGPVIKGIFLASTKPTPPASKPSKAVSETPTTVSKAPPAVSKTPPAVSKPPQKPEGDPVSCHKCRASTKLMKGYDQRFVCTQCNAIFQVLPSGRVAECSQTDITPEEARKQRAPPPNEKISKQSEPSATKVETRGQVIQDTRAESSVGSEPWSMISAISQWYLGQQKIINEASEFIADPIRCVEEMTGGSKSIGCLLYPLLPYMYMKALFYWVGMLFWLYVVIPGGLIALVCWLIYVATKLV